MTNRRAISLVEVLVVIAIIGILMALLFPALGSARSAAYRTQCANNLRQIGLALHHYHGAHQSLPSGWLGTEPLTSRPWAGGGPGWGWAALLLPYLEQTTLCERAVDFGKPLGDPAHYGVRRTSLGVYRCPADVRQVTPGFQATVALTAGPWAGAALVVADLADPGRGTAEIWQETRRLACNSCGVPLPPGDVVPTGASLAVGNYLGSFGSRALDPCEGLPVGQVCGGDGVLFHNSGVRWRHLRDGLSRTFLVGERGTTTDQPTWLGVAGAAKEEMARVVGVAEHPPQSRAARYADFSSYHPGGANFALADGSVTFVSQSIDLVVYRALGTRAGSDAEAGQ